MLYAFTSVGFCTLAGVTVGLKSSSFSAFLSCRRLVSVSRISSVLKKYRQIMLYSMNQIRSKFLILFSFIQ